ncbi:MAG: glycosyl hydrolase [Ignavibacteriota bacterium]
MPALVALAAMWSTAAPPASLDDLRRDFEHPPDDARIMMRWWWFGPAVSKPELEREMRVMKEGGIGGFEVQPVYPLELDGNMRYLSDEFLDALRFTGAKARELGLRYDLTLGSGWPFGGPHIPLSLAAPRLRVVHGDAPTLAEGESLVASYPDRQLYFVASHTGMKVKRAAVGAEGFVLNTYDRAAIDAHLRAVGDRLAESFGANPPRSVFSDSLEVERSDWTGDFLAEFRKRRGYDLTPYLPALAGDIGEKTTAVRHDWGRTLTELADDNYLKPLTDWAHRHGTLFRSQTYGTPPVDLSSNALVDLPEGEGSQWRRFSTSRWASSASHLYGRPITSSETWTWLHSPVFRATPLDMKAEADIHFLEGINQLIGHGWPYSPPAAGEPGYRFYAAAVFNEHNPWWIAMPDIALYLQRISFLMRQGRAVTDVALYIPTDDAYAAFTPGNVSVNKTVDQLLGADLVSQVLDAGYNFDFIDDGAIAHGGIPYPILILPAVERIPLATYRKLADFVRNGGTLIATKRAPSLAPGLMDAADTPQVADLSRSLFSNAGAKGHLVTDLAGLPATLHAALPVDLGVTPGVGFVHRKLDYADVYFIVNTTNQAVRTPASFRVSGKAEWWNPLTARADIPPRELAPYESSVVVLTKGSPVTQGELGPLPAPVSPDRWTISFPGESPHASKLGSWTEDEARRYFSGQVTYETTVTMPSVSGVEFLTFGEGIPVAVAEHNAGSGMRAMLEGPVREAAVVYVNGKRAGAVWCPPYRLDVGKLLQAGENRIRIVVANLAINQLAKGPLPDYKALNAKYGERFQPQDMTHLEPQPSGLLGPVRLESR